MTTNYAMLPVVPVLDNEVVCVEIEWPAMGQDSDRTWHPSINAAFASIHGEAANMDYKVVFIDTERSEAHRNITFMTLEFRNNYDSMVAVIRLEIIEHIVAE